MHLEYLLTLCKVGQIDRNLTVETSGTKQCLVEHIGTVGGSEDDNTAVCAETVHLCKQSVKRILALIVAAHCRILATCTTYGVDLVDEDNARSLLLCLTEEVADTTCTHADEHLHEVGTAHREEWNACFSLCEQCLTGARRAYKECSLRNLTTKFGVLLRLLEEVDNLLHLLLCANLTRYVLERDAEVVALLIHLRLRLADVENSATSSAAAHAAHHEEPQEDEEDNRTEGVEQRHESGVGVLLIAEIEYLASLHCRREIVVYAVNRAVCNFYIRFLTNLLRRLAEHVADFVRTHVHTQRSVVLVHNHTACIALVDIHLKLGVRSFLTSSTAVEEALAAICEEQQSQHHDDNRVDPVHVELRHLRLVVIARWIIVCVHINLTINRDSEYS